MLSDKANEKIFRENANNNDLNEVYSLRNLLQFLENNNKKAASTRLTQILIQVGL